jgi:hypothetical protein
VRPRLVAFVVAAVLSSAPARAQVGAPADAQAPVGVPGLRIVTGQSTVVGGNSAGARERALDEAFRQGIDQSLAELLDAPTRAAQAKAIKALGAKARTYVRRYRALEEGEAAGLYTVKLEVEVDEPALRRAVERWGAPAGVASPVAAPAPGLLLVAPSSEVAAPLLAALVAQGARAQLAEPAAAAPSAALAAAVRASLPQVAFVTSESRDEGLVRGTAKIGASCRVSARVVSTPAGLPVAEHASSPVAFGDDEAAARAQCFGQAAAELATRLAPAGAAAHVAGGDLRAVTIEADVVEPAAVVALLRNVRAVGSVSSAELRHVSPGKAEIRTRTRGLAQALAPALARDAGQSLVVSNVEVAGDVIKLRARLRPPTAVNPATTP